MRAVLDPESLDRLPLFQDLPPEQLSQINSLLHPQTVPAGTSIMTAGQPGEVAYLIARGTVKIYVEQADGSDVILAILGPGEIVGELSLVDSFGRSGSVVTLEECALFWIDRAAFQACLQTMPAMTHNLVRILARRLRLANSHIKLLATQDVFGRIAYLLLSFAQEYGHPAPNGDLVIPLHLTQSDLASLIGASRVRVNQVLSFYKQRHYISVDPSHYITVHDQAALAHRCQ